MNNKITIDNFEAFCKDAVLDVNTLYKDWKISLMQNLYYKVSMFLNYLRETRQILDYQVNITREGQSKIVFYLKYVENEIYKINEKKIEMRLLKPSEVLQRFNYKFEKFLLDDLSKVDKIHLEGIMKDVER